MVSAEVSELRRVFGTAFKAYAGDHPGADLTDQKGFVVAWADIRFTFWNVLILINSLIDSQILRQRFTEAIAFARTKRFPGFVIVCEEYLSDDAKEALPVILKDVGLVNATTFTGMVSDTIPQGSPHPSLELKRVSNQKMLQEYADINGDAHGLNLEDTTAGIAKSPLWKEEAYSVVGYMDGLPVSTASVLLSSDTLYVALVATTRAAQRKGYATTTMRHALSVAAENTGVKRSALHATYEGAFVYTRMGYQKAGTFHLYVIPPQVDGDNSHQGKT